MLTPRHPINTNQPVLPHNKQQLKKSKQASKQASNQTNKQTNNQSINQTNNQTIKQKISQQSTTYNQVYKTTKLFFLWSGDRCMYHWVESVPLGRVSTPSIGGWSLIPPLMTEILRKTGFQASPKAPGLIP